MKGLWIPGKAVRRNGRREYGAFGKFEENFVSVVWGRFPKPSTSRTSRIKTKGGLPCFNHFVHLIKIIVEKGSQLQPVVRLTGVEGKCMA